MVHMIVHPTRWSDLEKYTYQPKHVNPTVDFKDLHSFKHDHKDRSLVSIHPCVALSPGLGLDSFDVKKGFPADLAFSPSNALDLYDAMVRFSRADLPPPYQARLDALEPDTYFSSQIYIPKQDADSYASRLKGELTHWNATGFQSCVHAVFTGLSDVVQAAIDVTEQAHHSEGKDPYSNEFLEKHFMSFLLDLKSADRFPAVVFCLDEGLCEKLVKNTLNDLKERGEKCLEEENSTEEAKERERERRQRLKALKRARDKKDRNKNEDDDARDIEPDLSLLDAEDSPYPDQRFSFVQETDHMHPDDFSYWLNRCLVRTGWKKTHPFIQCLYRGIGVHHSALPRAYRSIVETLFRGKHIKVVVSTNTLAMGINMPCRTVCFAGDAGITPLLYRQMSGRAGRRGFDDVGYVCFFGVSPRKAFRWVKSPLAHISGYFPVTVNLTLRIMMYVNGIKKQNWALETFRALLSQPFHLGSEHERKCLSHQAKFHFRFALHYLYKKGLLDAQGKCRGMANLINHMPYRNCSVYPFVSLMEKGVLNEMCRDFRYHQAETARAVMAVLAHFFNRIPLPASITQESRASKDDVSLVILPPLAPEVQQVIDEHNQETLDTFTDYMSVFCRFMGDEDERFARAATRMPLSRHYFPPQRFKESESTEAKTTLNTLWREAKSVESVARSPFVSLSGCKDEYGSLEEMASSVHGSIRLNAHAEPTSSTRDLLYNEIKLNAYAIDVFTHRHVPYLIRSNHLDDATAWNALKDWVVVMHQLVTDITTLLPDVGDEETGEGKKLEERTAEEPPVLKCFKYILAVFIELLEEFNRIGFTKKS
jgi:hypothetical protein